MHIYANFYVTAGQTAIEQTGRLNLLYTLTNTISNTTQKIKLKGFIHWPKTMRHFFCIKKIYKNLKNTTTKY